MQLLLVSLASYNCSSASCHSRTRARHLTLCNCTFTRVQHVQGSKGASVKQSIRIVSELGRVHTEAHTHVHLPSHIQLYQNHQRQDYILGHSARGAQCSTFAVQEQPPIQGSSSSAVILAGVVLTCNTSRWKLYACFGREVLTNGPEEL